MPLYTRWTCYFGRNVLSEHPMTSTPNAIVVGAPIVDVPDTVAGRFIAVAPESTKPCSASCNQTAAMHQSSVTADAITGPLGRQVRRRQESSVTAKKGSGAIAPVPVNIGSREFPRNPLSRWHAARRWVAAV